MKRFLLAMAFVVMLVPLAACDKNDRSVESGREQSIPDQALFDQTFDERPVEEPPELVGAGSPVDSDWVLRPGQWEIQSRTTLSGRTVELPTARRCFEETTLLSILAMGFDDGQSGCEVLPMKRFDRTIAYSIVCSANQMTVDISTTRVDDDHFVQRLKRKMERDGESVEANSVTDYRRLGDCSV